MLILNKELRQKNLCDLGTWCGTKTAQMSSAGKTFFVISVFLALMSSVESTQIFNLSKSIMTTV